MAFLNWNEDLSVKIHSIDLQHQKLFDLINDFYENIKSRSNDENILKLIVGMKQYAQLHFSAEERYMKQFGYPGFDDHKKEHQTFIAKVSEVEKKVNEGKLIVSFEITSFLKNWIKDHIQTVDKKYSTFLIEKGVS
jgi:hemerythrin-like metal-binding protein